LDFDETLELMKERYHEHGYSNVVREGNSLLLDRGTRKHIVASEENIKEYSELVDSLSEYQPYPCECSISSNDYHEQYLQGMNLNANRTLIFRLQEDKKYIFKVPTNPDISIEIGNATSLFINYFRFNPSFNKRFSNYFFRGRPYRIPTIRIYGLENNSAEDLVKVSSTLFESCIFNLAYSISQPMRAYRYFRVTGQERISENQPITGTYSSDALKYYVTGIASELPSFKYLAFYQVLEFFFQTISDSRLYARMQDRLIDPDFLINQLHLDLLINEIESHKSSSKSEQMLKFVLEEYLSETELIDFLEKYEKEIGKEYYTKPEKPLFGYEPNEVRVQLKKDHVFSNVAKRIVIIRNAIAHSSDRYERKERYVPSSDNDAILRLEIPVIRFLADKVIVASGNPLKEI
jgi:hypothetical protein